MSEIRPKIPRWPGVILCVWLLGLAVFFWPGFVERVISLEWKIGDMRPVTYGLQALFGILAILSLWRLDGINSWWNRKLRNRKTFVFALIGSLLSVSITLAMMEATLRILDLPYKTSWTPKEYYRVQFDPEIGWVYVPNKSTVQQFVSGQAEIELYTDSIGSRVGAPGHEQDPGTPTVLFVGGSFTYGFGLPYQDTLPGKLESLPGFPYQTVNLGVEAYGTDQALLLLKRHFNRFNTKVVVYTFIGNHIERNINYDRRMLFRGARFVGTKPLYGLAEDGTLYLKKEPRTYEELTDLRIWSFVQFAWTHWGPRPSLDLSSIGETFTTDSEFHHAVDLTKTLILEMKEYVESQGATFIVLYWTYGASNSLILPMFEGMEVNVIDISANSPPDWGWKDFTLPGDSHPNAKANEHAAQLLYDEFLYRGLFIQENMGVVD